MSAAASCAGSAAPRAAGAHSGPCSRNGWCGRVWATRLHCRLTWLFRRAWAWCVQCVALGGQQGLQRRLHIRCGPPRQRCRLCRPYPLARSASEALQGRAWTVAAAGSGKAAPRPRVWVGARRGLHWLGGLALGLWWRQRQQGGGGGGDDSALQVHTHRQAGVHSHVSALTRPRQADSGGPACEYRTQRLGYSSRMHGLCSSSSESSWPQPGRDAGVPEHGHQTAGSCRLGTGGGCRSGYAGGDVMGKRRD